MSDNTKERRVAKGTLVPSDITAYSDPARVQYLAHKLLGKKVEISTHKNKKYMIQDPHGNYVHFGQLPYEDFTKHKDTKRRDAFRKRNAKWKDAYKYSPAWLSYHLLW